LDILTRLRNFHLFAALPAEDLQRVADITSRRSYARGSFLCRQGESGSTLFIMDSGGAVLYQPGPTMGTERSTEYLRPGQAVGEDALLLGDAYCFSLQASADLQALCIEKQDFDLLRQRYPHLHNRLQLSRVVKERQNVPSFPWQGPDEPTLLLRKRHWFAFARNLPIPILSLMGLTAIVLLLRRLGLVFSLPEASILIGVVPTGMVLWLFLDWQNDFYLITAKRILHEERAVLFYETWDEAPMSKVQDTTVIRGFWGGVLGFGTLRVQTAGLRGAMVLDYLPNPEDVQELICKQSGALGSHIYKGERDDIRQELIRQTGLAAAESDAVAEIPVPLPQETFQNNQRPPGRFSLSSLLQLTFREGNQVTWRKHWIFLVRKASLPLLAVLSTAMFIVFSLVHPSAPYSPSLLLVSVLLWTVSVGWLWWQTEDWRNDLYILTDRLIIDLERKPLFFSEERRQATLDMIQNVSLRKQGVLSAIFNYGDVLIQTAGALGQFTFVGVSDPRQVQREIFRRVEAYQDSKRTQQKQQEKAGISQWFKVYHEISNDSQKPPDSL